MPAEGAIVKGKWVNVAEYTANANASIPVKAMISRGRVIRWLDQNEDQGAAKCVW